jgi:glycosyltransferase involved in cell wall biosynthesis
MSVIEILDVSLTETVSARLRGRYIDTVPGTKTGGHLAQFSGWVLGRESPAVAVELLNGSNVCRRVRVNIHRPDVAEIYPQVPEAEYSGFKIQMSLLGLTPEIEFLLQAVLKDQSRLEIGVIRAQRRWREDINAEDQLLVSVVIPCYNQAHFLGEAIESALAQTYPHLEIVVVDDGSTDNIAAVVAGYPGVRCLRQENQGLSAARNTGLRHSIGECLVFLDADDRLLPRAIEVGLACLRDHSECAFVYGRSRFMAFDGSSFHGPPPQPRVEEDYYLALLKGCPIFATGSVMYRREIFELVGGFDPSLSPSADYDLYYRIASRFPIRCHEETIAEYRKHGTSMTRGSELMLRYNLAALRSQWKHVKRSRQKKEAYKTGIRFWKQAWGRRVVDEIRAAIAEGEWKRATEGMLSLLRYSPSCLGSMLNDYPLPRKTLGWIQRRVRKSTQVACLEDGSQQLLHRIRNAVRAALPTDGKVIVVDKGDGDILGLSGPEEWHFPPIVGGLPERLFASGPRGSVDVDWMQSGRTYDFRLYAGRERRQLLAATSLMHKEGAAITATPGPVQIGEMAGKATIAWETGGDSHPQVFMSEQKAYAGYYPRGSCEAIAQLEGLRAKGAQYLLFPQTAFWWLEHYPEFARHLENRYRLIVRPKDTEDACMIFDLCHPLPQDTSLPSQLKEELTRGPIASQRQDVARLRTTFQCAPTAGDSVPTELHHSEET